MLCTVVLLDTSASMNQRTSSNISLLDAAKAAIEQMCRRFPNERQAKFMLVTPRNGGTVEVGWWDTQANFVQKVKMAQARDTSDMAGALRCCFDLLRDYFLSQGRGSYTDIDEYGQGRKPWETKEASSVWVLTDGCELSSTAFQNVTQSLIVPPSEMPASDMFYEANRWDQRVWVTLLRFPGCGTVPQELVNSCGAMGEASERAGGRSQVVTNMRSLMQAVESLSSRLQAQTVSVLLTPLDAPPEAAADTSPKKGPTSSCTAIISMRAAQRAPIESMHSWPIPEPFTLVEGSTQITPRPSIPLIHYRVVSPTDAPREASYVPREPGGAPSQQASILDMLNPDVYDVENCPVTDILRAECRAVPNSIMRLYVVGSASCASQHGGKGVGSSDVPAPGVHSQGSEEPFGFLRMATYPNQPLVFQLVLLPYSYPRLCHIIDDLRGKTPVPAVLRQELENYVRAVPSYYVKPLRVAFKNARPPLPFDRQDPPVPVSILGTLSRYRHTVEEAKEANKRARLMPGQTQAQPVVSGGIIPQHHPAVLPPPTASRSSGQSSPGVSSSLFAQQQHAFASREWRAHAPAALARHPAMQRPPPSSCSEPPKTSEGTYCNLVHIPREALLSQLRRMRARLLGGAAVRQDQLEDGRSDRAKHAVPIADMGNFHEVLKRREAANPGGAPLRDPWDDADRRRRNLFGNPFRKGGGGGGTGGFLSDEIDEATGAGGRIKRERRRVGAKRSQSVGPHGGGAGGGDGVSRDSSPSVSRENSPAPDFDPSRAHSAPPAVGKAWGGGTHTKSTGSGQGGVVSNAEAEEEVTQVNKWRIKLEFLRLIKGRHSGHAMLMSRISRLRGSPETTRKLIMQLSEAARNHRRPGLAEMLDALCV